MDLKVKDNWDPTRYGELVKPYKNEVVMLRGNGCFHSKCTFCDYHLDKSDNKDENYLLNKNTLSMVKGLYGELEVICSGSFQELDKKTLECIRTVCYEKNIGKLSLECHYIYKDTLHKYTEFFKGIDVSYRVGVETFDVEFREHILNKKMGDVSASEISKYFDYCNLMVGIKGQTKEMIVNDIELAKKYFKRICIGVFEDNSTVMEKDVELVKWFEEIAPSLKEDGRFYIILNPKDYPLGDGCMSEGKL